ncbi:hypothetical protein SAMN04487979_117104 [Flavobacterium sp. ov086]|nr:hypothetical protein SAMN04487979_117104 [Flavobacterium sp. ov086]
MRGLFNRKVRKVFFNAGYSKNAKFAKLCIDSALRTFCFVSLFNRKVRKFFLSAGLYKNAKQAKFSVDLALRTLRFVNVTIDKNLAHFAVKLFRFPNQRQIIQSAN